MNREAATPIAKPAGLLLDMDGTLVDTEGMWLEAERAAAARFGGHLPEAAESELLGLDTDTLLELLISRYGARTDPLTLREAVLEEVHGRLAEARACPGAAELVLSARAADVRCALVSNSPASVVQATLEPHPWAGELEVRVSADDAEHPKPAPDLYLAALRALRLPPSECLAIEDSPTGARGAIRAGLVCLGVAADGERATALRALTPHVLPTLAHVRRLLGLPHAGETGGAGEVGANAEAP